MGKSPPITLDEFHRRSGFSQSYERIRLSRGAEIGRLNGWRTGEVFVPGVTHHRVAFHSEHLLGLTLKIGKQEWKREKGQFTSIIPSGEETEGRWDTMGSPVNAFHLLISQENLEDTLRSAGENYSGLELIPGNYTAKDQESRRLLHSFLAEREQGGLCNQLVQEAIFQNLIISILRNFSNRRVKQFPDQSRANERLKRSTIDNVLQYIESNVEEAISLDTLANLAGVSRFQFCRIFKQSTGKTANQVLNEFRAQRAKRLIEQEGEWKSLAAIAVDCGYCDQSHMGRHFRSLFGKTPGEFLPGGVSTQKRAQVRV
ncbi:MAG: AraC family transcriptional regulator [Verrucomicrobiota bacterium]